MLDTYSPEPNEAQGDEYLFLSEVCPTIPL